MSIESTVKKTVNGKTITALVLIVLALTVLELAGYGPIALAARYRAYRAKAGAA